MSGKNPLGNGKEPQSYEGINIIVPVGGWNFVKAKVDPSANLAGAKKNPVGSFWLNYILQNLWYQSQPNVWTLLASGAGDIVAINGTANQITASTVAGVTTLSIPSSFIAPGSIASTTTLTGGTGITATTGNIVASAGNITATLGNIAATAGSVTAGTTVSAGTTITAGTGITATTGNIVASAGNITTTVGSITSATTLTATAGAITATNGNLVLASAGNKLLIHATTAASDSVGTSAALDGASPSQLVVATTAVTAASKIFLTYNAIAGTPGFLSIGTIVPNTSFQILSSANGDTSTVNYLIIN